MKEYIDSVKYAISTVGWPTTLGIMVILIGGMLVFFAIYVTFILTFLYLLLEILTSL